MDKRAEKKSFTPEIRDKFPANTKKKKKVEDNTPLVDYEAGDDK